jgi:DNA-binding transcriptional LysR family regulator
MLLTFRQLEIFITVGSLENITKAAEKLKLTQAAVSMAINEIEKLLHNKLFDRVGRRIILNEYGRVLLPKAIELIGKVRDFESYLNSEKDIRGQIIIGATRTIGTFIIPRYINQFIKQYNEVKFNLIVANTKAICELVDQYELDIAFIEGLNSSKASDKTFWRKDVMYLFTSSTNPLASKDIVTPEDCEKAKWVLRENGSGTRDVFENAIAGKVKSLDIEAEIGSIGAIKALVEGGNYLSCLSFEAIRKEVDEGNFKILNTPWLNIERDLNILINKDKQKTNLLKALIDFMVNVPAENLA